MYSDASVIIIVRIFDLGLKGLAEKFNEVMLSLGCKDQDYKIFVESGMIELFYKYKNTTWYSSEIEAINETYNYVKRILIDKAISAIMDSEYKGKISIVKIFNDGINFDPVFDPVVGLNVHKKEDDEMEAECCKDCPRLKETIRDKKKAPISFWVRKFIEGNPWYETMQHEYGYELRFVYESNTPFGNGVVSIDFEHPDKPTISIIVYLDDYGDVDDVTMSLYNRYDLDVIRAIYHLIDGLINLWPKERTRNS